MCRKTEQDVKHERAAIELNASLIASRISAIGGGRRGPFTVLVDQLDEREVDRVITAIRQALGE